jgi:hypothetical protein
MKAIKGTNGFTFEFKAGQFGLAFIRYQDGERELVQTHYMSTNLFSDFDLPVYVRDYLRPFAGASEKVIKFALKMALSQATQTAENIT